MAAEKVNGLNVNLAENVGRIVEGVGFLALGRERVLECGNPGLECREGEELFLGEVGCEVNGHLGSTVW